MSLLNYSSSIVRKASATVQSTINVASGRRGSNAENQVLTDNDVLSNAKEKITLHLKASPSKDAKTTERFAVKSGYLHKRNEQGSWQKRYLCLVPHTFLYYFEHENSDAPRGVIDLELFNNFSIENVEGNVLKISTVDENSLRSFYFQDDDMNQLSDWITSLYQDRFQVVREERDNYKLVQDQFSGEIKSQADLYVEVARERQGMVEDVQVARKREEEALTAMKRVLVRFGISEGDMNQIDSPNKAGDALSYHINQMQKQHEDMQSEEQQKHQRNQEVLHAKLTAMESDLAQHQHQHHAKDQHIMELSSAIDKKQQEIMIEAEKSSMNMHIAMNAKNMADDKVMLLSEQKRVLVKEVKTLRSKLEQAQEMISQLKSLNDRLTNAVATIHMEPDHHGQVHTSIINHDTLSSTTSSYKHDDGRLSPTNNHIMPPPSYDNNIIIGDHEHDDDVSHNSSISSKHDIESSSTASSSIPSSVAATSLSWGLPVHELQEYDWLSDEQRSLLEKRSQIIQASSPSHVDPPRFEPPSPSSATKPPSSSTSSYFSPTISSFLTSSPINSTHTAVLPPPSVSMAPHHVKKEAKRGSILSMFNSNTDKPPMVGLLDINEDYDDDNHSDIMSDTHSIKSDHNINKHQHNNIPANSYDEDDRTPSAMRLHCLRCQGTVEGPKYSTCRCAIPALSPDDLTTSNHHMTNMASAGSSIVGMFSKGAGGIAGGFARRVTTVSGMIMPSSGMTKDSSSSHGSLNSD